MTDCVPVAYKTASWLVALLCLVQAVPAQQAQRQPGTPSVSFNQQIRPILSDKCFHCHGPDEGTREADLRFDIKESAYAVIVPGKPGESELIARISETEDADYQMPPAESHKPLKQLEIKLLTEWVKQGAPWDRFWAYEEPQPVEVAPPAKNAWDKNWIDVMVRDRLTGEGIQPSPEADKITLIRRLYLDVIGLPPTPQQVAAFLEDTSPTAFEKQVDLLLQSEHFGEKMAVYWLDLVRFADTVGYHGDQDHNISPYRDWVINAFNQNMPFDQFTREQLAGDLIPGSTRQQKIASGYNRLLQTTHEGGLQPKEYRAIYAADRVRNVSSVWMGATVGCAQCHDHKYDPYTAKDFYSLSAFFADIDDEQHFKNGTNALPTRRSPELLVISEEDGQALDAARKIRDRRQNELNQAKRALQEFERKLKQLAKSEPSRDAQDKEGQEATRIENDSKLETLKQQVKQATDKLKRQDAEVRKLESRGTWTMITKPLEQPREVRILPRGNWLDESGPIVEPAVPEFLGALNREDGQRLNRLDLANWLTDNTATSGKLTARVFANRFWYLLMGVGVSRSLDDFGGQGEPPAYPELLDNLALDFAKDWNVKRFLRQVLVSQTYRQSSVTSPSMARRDPYNQLFARQSRYRMSAEAIRDSALAISGLLNVDQVGGRSVKPYQPAGYYRHLNFPPRKYAHTANANQWRRGVYVHWQRMFLHPTFKALDAPTREECTAQRPQSNTPLAALALLNDPCFVESAIAFAQRIVTEVPGDQFQDRLEFAFNWSINRKPTDEESDVMRELFLANLDEYRQDVAAAKAVLAVGSAPVDESIDPAVLASWTAVARALMNLSETVTRF